MLWHKIWAENGRLEMGYVAGIMRRTRAKCQYAIRSIKRDENNAAIC
jgi:hypothetical protein